MALQYPLPLSSFVGPPGMVGPQYRQDASGEPAVELAAGDAAFGAAPATASDAGGEAPAAPGLLDWSALSIAKAVVSVPLCRRRVTSSVICCWPGLLAILSNFTPHLSEQQPPPLSSFGLPALAGPQYRQEARAAPATGVGTTPAGIVGYDRVLEDCYVNEEDRLC